MSNVDSSNHYAPLWVQLVPLVLLGLVAGSLYFYTGLDVDTHFDDRHGGFPPIAWTRASLIGIMAASVLLCVVRIFEHLLRPRHTALERLDAPAPYPSHDNVGVVSCIALMVAYGACMRYIGFPLSTLSFLVAWMFLAGERKLRFIFMFSGLATVFLIYLFAKVAYMPLPRGSGYFDTFTVALYRMLGVF